MREAAAVEAKEDPLESSIRENAAMVESRGRSRYPTPWPLHSEPPLSLAVMPVGRLQSRRRSVEALCNVEGWRDGFPRPSEIQSEFSHFIFYFENGLL